MANIWTGVDLGGAQTIAAFRLLLYATSGFAAVPIGGTLLIESSPDNATLTVEKPPSIVAGADWGSWPRPAPPLLARPLPGEYRAHGSGLRMFSLLSAVVPTRLPRGTGGQVLTIDATTLLPKWA